MANGAGEAVDQFYIEIGRRVRDARALSGMTQGQLANLVKMTRSSIANVEAGRQRIPVHILAMIAVALDVDVAKLFSPTMLSEDVPVLPGLSAQLENESPTTRDFVQGAIAQLGISTGKEDPR